MLVKHIPIIITTNNHFQVVSLLFHGCIFMIALCLLVYVVFECLE